MRNSFLHIIPVAMLSLLIIIMGAGVATLPECCIKAGERLSISTHRSECHCHTICCYDSQHHTSQDNSISEVGCKHLHLQDFSNIHNCKKNTSHCQVTIEKIDLMQHMPQDVMSLPICNIPSHFILPSPQQSSLPNKSLLKLRQPHSPPNIIGRMKFYCTFII